MMKFFVVILFQVLAIIGNPIYSQNFPKETIILEATVKVIQDTKRGGISGGNVYITRGPLREIVSDLIGFPRSRTLEKGVLKDYLFRDSNSLVEVRTQTNFSRRVANLALDQLQFRFNFTIDTVKIDTIAWVISSPKKLADTVSLELEKDDFGYAELSQYYSFKKEIIVCDSSVDEKIQVSAENYDINIIFEYLRKRYGFEIEKVKLIKLLRFKVMNN